MLSKTRFRGRYRDRIGLQVSRYRIFLKDPATAERVGDLLQ
jgi:hypothetical protein